MKLLVFISIFICIAIFACGCTGTAPAAEDPTATPTPTAVETATPAQEAPENVVTTLGGIGNGTRTVTLDAGLYVFAMQHDGTGPFSVDIESEEVFGTLAHSTGKYDGQQAFGLQDLGEYEFAVTADGNWTIAVERPQVIDGVPPQTFTGIGDGATPLFQIPAGNATFVMTIENSTECAVWLYNSTGSLVFDPTDTYVQPLHWHEGAYNGTAVTQITEAGNYLLNVMAEGPWTITVDA